MFVEGNTDKLKSFEIERLLNKYQVKKKRGQAIEYLVCWKRYGLKWDRWYNIKEFSNVATFVEDYEVGLATTKIHFINEDVDFSLSRREIIMV